MVEVWSCSLLCTENKDAISHSVELDLILLRQAGKRLTSVL